MKKTYIISLLLAMYLLPRIVSHKEYSPAVAAAQQNAPISTNKPMWAVTTPAASWEATIRTGTLGYSTSSAGDVNGDGFDDIISGAPFTADQKGVVLVHYGGSSGISGSWVYASSDYGSYFGNSVSKAGDVNGDGFDDVIIAAYGYPGITPYLFRGKVFVFYGSSAGLSATPGWTDSTLQAGSLYGRQVNAAGDVNGDGYDDVMVSAPQWDDLSIPGFNQGKVYVYYGSATGLSTTANWTKVGDQSTCQLGYGMGSAGDVNNDGYDDVILSASYYYNGQMNEGRMYLYYGSAAGLAASPSWTTESNLEYGMLGRYRTVSADVNGDGYVDIAAVTSEMGIINYPSYIYVYYNGPGGLSTTPGWSIASLPATGGFGDMASMGDMNNDGYDDIVVSQPKFNSQGRVCIYYGTPAGLSNAPGWTASYTDPNPWNGPRFGLTVANAGDIDNDGINDVLVGSADVNNWGKIYLYRTPVLLITLPLKLLSFASVCKGDEMQLKWQTADEENTQQFTIERSDNGNTWQSVANLPARGASEYIYNMPSSTAIGYYRLKMIDIDGSFTYSRILSVRNSCRENTFSWTVAPNPVRSSGSLQLDLRNYAGSSSPAKVRLTDMQGKAIVLGTITISASVAYQAYFDLPALAAGMYTVSINNEQVNESKTIVVTK